MKGEDKQQLEGLLSIFAGYQIGTVIAIVLILLLLALFVFPRSFAAVLLTVIIVILLPYVFTRKSNENEE